MSKSKILLTLLFTIVAQAMMAQGRVISGTVEDAMGPIMMANVVERDGNNRIVNHTQTDMMGNFSMEIKNPKNKLVASYVGSKTKILTIGDQKTFNIKLEDDKTTLGEVKVVVYDASDRKVGEKTMCTAGKPAKLQLDVWTQHDAPVLNADGEDLAFVTVSLTDAKGTVIPDANDQLSFEVSGAGRFEAVCNGDATSLESFKKPTMRLFSGQLVIVVRSDKKAGNLTLKVKDSQRKISETITLKIE